MVLMGYTHQEAIQKEHTTQFIRTTPLTQRNSGSTLWKRSYCKLYCSAWPLLIQIRSIRSYQGVKDKEFLFCKYFKYSKLALKKKATAQYSKWLSLTDLKSLDQHWQKIQISVAVLALCNLDNSCAYGTEAACLQTPFSHYPWVNSGPFTTA